MSFAAIGRTSDIARTNPKVRSGNSVQPDKNSLDSKRWMIEVMIVFYLSLEVLRFIFRSRKMWELMTGRWFWNILGSQFYTTSNTFYCLNFLTFGKLLYCRSTHICVTYIVLHILHNICVTYLYHSTHISVPLYIRIVESIGSQAGGRDPQAGRCPSPEGSRKRKTSLDNLRSC